MERAVAAAASLVRDSGLSVDHVVIVQNSNKLAVRILPCDLLARVAVVGGYQTANLEIAVAESLAAQAAPVARIDGRVERLVHERDGFVVTFWSYYEEMAHPRSHRPNTRMPSIDSTRLCETFTSRRPTSPTVSPRPRN